MIKKVVLLSDNTNPLCLGTQYTSFNRVAGGSKENVGGGCPPHNLRNKLLLTFFH